ncbi:hypothetical protein [Desulfogranum mediterraneum]|uniref:hypothetical protein n=1 Tax=Desulfogranum mediterraneum TaxID=160661 RepID=UPI0004019477|nr:hypothetical protein [Desulfogranum mediterraneum]
MKKIWITAIEKEQQQVQSLLTTAAQYGLEAKGHFWEDDLKKMAWLAVSDQLQERGITLWVIVVDEAALGPGVRYGLSLLTIVVQQKRPELPILVVDSSGKMKRDVLPGIFADIPMVTADSHSLGAKFAAMANMPAKKQEQAYRLRLHANPGFGIWFEVGPGTGEQWQGGLLGLNGGTITAHGVGPAGRLPERSVLEYPLQGMELSCGGERFTAWGVENVLAEEDSYYLKVEGAVSSFIFGELPQGDAPELHLLKI